MTKMGAKENFAPKTLFPEKVLTKAEQTFEPLMSLQPAQEFIERGFFNETVAEESKVFMPASITEGGMEVDEFSSSSEEICKEQEEPSQHEQSLRMSNDFMSQEVLQNIALGRDCLLGDEELMGTKKGLTCRQTPMALIA